MAVLYRWRVRAGTEAAFAAAWRDMTDSIRVAYGTGGSRLHTMCDAAAAAAGAAARRAASDSAPDAAGGGTWFAGYAMWPSRGAWEAAQALPSANPVARAAMGPCIAESLDPLLLEVAEDMLLAAPAGLPRPAPVPAAAAGGGSDAVRAAARVPQFLLFGDSITHNGVAAGGWAALLAAAYARRRRRPYASIFCICMRIYLRLCMPTSARPARGHPLPHMLPHAWRCGNA